MIYRLLVAVAKEENNESDNNLRKIAM